jgi:hypothetical protein
MNMEQTITNGNKLVELDPQLFERRIENHPFHARATEEQKKEYLDNLPCSFCGHVGGSCECDPKLSLKKNIINRVLAKSTVTHENQREGSTNALGYESIEEKYKTGKVSYLNDTPMTLETLQEEFSVMAEQRGFVSPIQIMEALGIPVNGNTKKGKYRFIASILYEQGFITQTQINEALDSLKME